jgi:hypothetical protein
VVQRSAEQQQLEKLNKDHERLLRDIAKKRAALLEIERLGQQLSSALASRLQPLRAEVESLAKQLRTGFEQLLGSGSRLGRREKAKVRQVYLEVMAELSPDLLGETDDADAEGGSRVDEKGEADAGARGRPGRPRSGARSAEAGYSAPKHSDDKASTLRSLFRRLAIALHPDKVQDVEQKAERTSLMKDVTRAYEAGDVARLLELERAHLACEAHALEPELCVRVARVQAAIKELRRQLRELTAACKLARQALPVTLEGRRKDDAAIQRELDQLVQQVECELEGLRKMRDFVGRFCDGKMGLREFLAGPEATRRAWDEDVFEAILESFVEDFDDFSPSSRPRRGKARSRGRSEP